MSRASPPLSIRRRWERLVLRTQGRLDDEVADRTLPWLAAMGLFVLFLLSNAATLRALDGGSGAGPWLQAAWRRGHGGIGHPVAGVDPSTGSGSIIGELVLWVTRLAPPLATFAAVQAGAIALAAVPLWRLARNVARLRVGASLVIVAAMGFAPTLHRANLSIFHPELVALPALLWGYLFARRGQWWRYGAMMAVVLACRADLGLTVAAVGALVFSRGERRPGAVTAAVGLAWTAVGSMIIDPSRPEGALTPAGEFVARSTTPLAVFSEILLHPITELRGLFAEPSVLFLVVVLAPLLFLPLVSPRHLAVALPCLMLAMIADRAVQDTAPGGVLSLSPAAAHIAPAMAFVLVALVFALERIGEPSVTRVNVDRRVLTALLAGVVLLFATEAPTSPYRQPWDWGSRDVVDGARLEAADRVDPDAAVAVSPQSIMVVAERAHLIELPPDPADLTASAIDSLAPGVDVIMIDTTGLDPDTDRPLWSEVATSRVVGRFEDRGFGVDYRAQGIWLLVRSDA